ncbi:probable E3 ubiquitin-protein ligase RHG1A isoform X2 [Solanum dulcamara]|uniref:probable E3 ubiquitin-protein ligase RHG1A isoform X2 n=1 Tax=Solanum dulcamara TaxID=45834 RepID=UPI0024863E0C|nr:probable E3 ubiquitin-protein ligase RHG1A isoform X2 [Solanum dulcamara]
MQGQRSAIGSLPETLGFTHGSTSSDGGIDQQICWNNMRNPAQSRLPDYMVPSNETNIPFLSHANQERQNVIGWNLGESSSSNTQNIVSRSESKTNHAWASTMSACPGTSHFSAEQHYGSSNILSLGDVEINLNNQIADNTLFSQGSTSSTVPNDLNRSSGLEGHDDDEDDDCQVMECAPTFKSDGPGKERMSTTSTSSDPLVGPSATNGFLMDERDGRPGCTLDGRRMACKRKAVEGHLGQSSGSGSPNYLLNSLWRSIPAPNNVTAGANSPAPTESRRNINLPEQVNPRLGLAMGGATMEGPVALPASRRAEIRRNFRLRINGSHQQASIPSNLFPTVGNDGNVSMSSEPDSLRLLRNESLDLRSVSAADNGNPRSQPVVGPVPSLRQSAQRWDSSSSRAGSSSSYSVFGERNSAAYEQPSSRSVPRNISQHPMFIPASDLRNLNQNPVNWGLAGGNISIAGNVASSSRSGPSSVAPSSSSSWVQHRNPQQYPRRLSEYVRRSVLSSAGSEPVSHNGNTPPHLSFAASQEIGLSGHPGHRGPSSSRSAVLLERQLDGAMAVPYSWRTLAAAGEGRSRLVSEIRNVLDAMRRGESLRFEDVMILDQSGFFGMVDIQDRHRDMRLDVDNMSYEELLALEERIGNVCTGLTEETILNHLKQRKHVCIRTEEATDAEPCCICQEEYKDGEDLGKLECGHDFHTDCVKQWLMQKNLCPICKTTGLNTSGKH